MPERIEEVKEIERRRLIRLCAGSRRSRGGGVGLGLRDATSLETGTEARERGSLELDH